ncbi:CPBP family intramembrane glutamic endopeptidase [Paenibacillaceae bacterium WGS1546]|uniref:CPBP family intramembrane glutamic endopeptidase n=1 Tax=Cohnella sp. WGS1546 TaxID=3366810 RepID=UPI00372D232E
MFILLCLALLTVSYKLVEILLTMSTIRNPQKYTVLYWAFAILIIVPLFRDNYIFKMPIHHDKALPIFGIIAVINIIIARYSGYNPIGNYYIVNFIVTYPIIEEIIFRGLILPNLKPFLGSSEILQILWMPVTLPVIVSAFLFAICHLQYYKLSALSMRYMVVAFSGGIVLGAMTEMTQSILYGLLLHIVFNSFSVIFAKRLRKG